MASKQKNFEQILEKLEKIVSELETGELGLDKSIEKFEEGIAAYKECKTALHDAEKKIKILTDELSEEDYQP